MYAIIRVGGHQEKVIVGERISVDHIKKDPGSEIRFTPLLVSADDGTVVSDRHELEGTAAVLGTIVDHVRGDKIDVFQYRQKTGYRRHTGHRQLLTLVEISEIRLGERVVKLEDVRAAEEEARKAEESERPVAEAEGEEKKPKAAAKKGPKAPAKKAPAAKATARKAATKKPAVKKTVAKEIEEG